MAKHTSGPWVAHSTKSFYVFGPASLAEQAGLEHGPFICNASSQENARRIVACVNACDGIETSVLEQHALGVIGAEHSQELKNVKKQRDELLEALKYCRQKIAYMPAHGEWYSSGRAIEMPDSAIANTEGRKK